MGIQIMASVMSTFKIATWNVNSLRVRLPHVLTWLKEHQPDVLALQETKLPDADFPVDALTTADYTVIFSGQRTYNGVALLSRQKPKDIVTDIPGFSDEQRRVLGATVGDVRIFNLYVPNGQSVGSDKFQYKLNWLQALTHYITAQMAIYPKLILLGDFNIAPETIDVHDPKLWEGQVLFSQPERRAFQALLSLGLVDCFRHLSPNEQQFSWWDYRLNAFKRKMGLRIDHILASKALHPSECVIDSAPRSWERPSDHAPVSAVFEDA